MIICCTPFGVRSFAFEVRSWAGNYVPINLYQVDAILCFDKIGWGPQAQLSLSEVQILAKRRQISAEGSLRARSPDSVQLPCWGSQAPRTQLALKLFRLPGQQGPGSAETQADSNCQHVTEAGVGGKVHHCLKVWAGSVGSLVKGSGRTELPACFLDPLAHPLAEARWDGGYRGEGQDPLLTSLSTWRPPLWWPFAASATSCCSVTVAHLGEEPTAEPTNGWAQLLTVTQWQFAWGRDPLWCRPMAERTSNRHSSPPEVSGLLVTVAGNGLHSNGASNWQTAKGCALSCSITL